MSIQREREEEAGTLGEITQFLEKLSKIVTPEALKSYQESMKILLSWKEYLDENITEGSFFMVNFDDYNWEIRIPRFEVTFKRKTKVVKLRGEFSITRSNLEYYISIIIPNMDEKYFIATDRPTNMRLSDITKVDDHFLPAVVDKYLEDVQRKIKREFFELKAVWDRDEKEIQRLEYLVKKNEGRKERIEYLYEWLKERNLLRIRKDKTAKVTKSEE